MDCIHFHKKLENTANLPHYPNPGLKETLARYLEWLEPLATPEQLAQAKKTVDEFHALSAYPAIESYMNHLAEDSEDSYIYDHWVRGHLEFRSPICPHTSVPILYRNEALVALTQSQRAAALLWATANLYQTFQTQGHGSYQIGNKTYSNDELYGALASINHIAPQQDIMYICDGLSHHSLLLYQNRIYKIAVLSEQGTLISYGSILNAVEKIMATQTSGLEVNFNTVTSEPQRDLAGYLLAEMLENPINQQAYQQVKDAIAVVNLDVSNPQAMRQQLYSSCCDAAWYNRFYGKGTQFTVCQNGAMSMVIDHTYCDGGIESYLVNQVGQNLSHLDTAASTQCAYYGELCFDITGYESRLRQCFSRYQQALYAFDTKVVKFPALTRVGLQEKGIRSGDGFFHLALQVAQQRTWGEIRNTYISVDCRKFFRGRTEVNRPVTHDSKAFVTAFVQGKGDKVLLEQALNAHHHRTKQAQEGMGVNRYLFTLQTVCKDNQEAFGLVGLPSLFTSDGYGLICEDTLSTTSFGEPDMWGCFFPPTIDHGIGIFYQVSANSFGTFTANLEDGDLLDRFCENLNCAIDDMLAIL